jgi:molybdate transport system ATP-binding protein
MTPATPSAALVTIDEVDVVLGGAVVLEAIQFALREGESWAVLGGNGAGKSTFLKLLRGDVWPHPRSRGTRIYFFAGGPSESHIGAREQMPLVSPELQDTYVRRDWDVPVRDVVRSGFHDSVWVHEPLTADQERRVDAALALVGLEGAVDRSILELSTGEARRAFLARAFAAPRRVLLLDEFARELDAVSRARLLSAVSAVARAGTPVLMSTHRADDLVPEITHAVVLERGRITAAGPRDLILAEWGAPVTHVSSTVPAVPTFGSRLEPSACARSMPSSGRRSLRSSASAVRAVGAPEEPVFELENVEVFVEGRRVLERISWRMTRDENWVVRGPNGSGKTTFLRLLLGEEQPAPGGAIRRAGLGRRPSVWEVKERIGLVGARVQGQHRYDETGEEVVLSGFHGTIGLHDAITGAQRDAATRWMERLGVADLASRQVLTLSYGELRKLLLARAMVLDPAVLLLDEPLAGLDAQSRASFLGLVEDLAESGTQMVFATHHDDELVAAVNRELELADGRIVYRGPRR